MEDEGLRLLTNLLYGKDWFCGAEREDNRYVVYTKYMNLETMTTVPDEVCGKQVVVHFIAHKRAVREQFTDNGIATKPTEIPFENLEELGSDLTLLTNELDRLERMCGSRTLADIFFEVHDKNNAVTNYSASNPVIRQAMEKLYNEYGFDILYEELEL